MLLPMQHSGDMEVRHTVYVLRLPECVRVAMRRLRPLDASEERAELLMFVDDERT